MEVGVLASPKEEGWDIDLKIAAFCSISSQKIVEVCHLPMGMAPRLDIFLPNNLCKIRLIASDSRGQLTLP
jgi:hypothetical protein